MNPKITILLILLMMAFVTITPSVSAKAYYLRNFGDYYGIEDTELNTCVTCHFSGILQKNTYGMDFMTNGRNFETIETLDSDGDGFTNLAEINALTFPGDPDNHSIATEDQSSTATSLISEQNTTTAQPTLQSDGQQIANSTEPTPEVIVEPEIPGFELIQVFAAIFIVVFMCRMANP